MNRPNSPKRSLLDMLGWSLRLDRELVMQVPGLPLGGKLSLIVNKYLRFLKGRLLGAAAQAESLLVFHSRFCYNEALDPASLQRVYCASHTLKELLPERPVVMDVGANIGQFNFFARHYLGARRVVSVEPVRECFELLAKNAAIPDDCLCCAVSDREGVVVMHVAKESSQLSSYVADEDGNYRDSYAVPARTLDAIAAELGVERVDLLKIDTEGSEFDVLNSAPELLLRTHAVLVEASVFRTCTGNLFRIGTFLEEKGFTLVELSAGEGRRPTDLDAVFVRI